MSNRLVLLTTDTPHHKYFAWKIQEQHPLTGILLETNMLKAPFDTVHPIEKRRDDFERQTLLSNAPKDFSDFTQTREVTTCNDSHAISHLQRWAPHWLIVFGTGFLQPHIMQMAEFGCLNLHGGNPEFYRGLDSHYWTIYHRDFGNLVTTMHFLDAGLDTGPIVSQQKLELRRDLELFQLRALNTQACVDLSLAAFTKLAHGHSLPSRPQKTKGRYYSFMPAELKELCVKNFARHVKNL